MDPKDYGFDARVPVFAEFDMAAIERGARDIPYGPDKNLWISSDCFGKIVRMTSTSAQKTFSYCPNCGRTGSRSTRKGCAAARRGLISIWSFLARSASCGIPQSFPARFDARLYAGIGSVGPHALRHTAATNMLELGVHPKVVADRLGHSTTRLTMDVYSHVVPALESNAAGKVDSTLRKIFGQHPSAFSQKAENSQTDKKAASLAA